MASMRVLLVLGLFACAGCALVRSPIVERDGAELDVGAELDAPLPDTALPDAPIGPLDTPPGCGSTPRCEGETLVTCSADREVRQDCAMASAYCEAGTCRPRACEPGEITCSGAEEHRCDARGALETVSDCSRGCVPGTGCAPETACALAVAGAIGVETRRVNTCGQGNDANHEGGCSRTDRTGSDSILRLEVPTRADYRIELVPTGGGDAVLYLRRACADATSEVACDDDSAAGFGSRLDLTLDPGDYFLVLDSFRDDEGPDGRCGEMDLSVTLR